MPWLVTWCLSLELTLNIHMQLQQEAACCFHPPVLTTAVEVCSHHSVCSASKRSEAACYFRPSVVIKRLPASVPWLVTWSVP